jgi:hypothetical protein
MMNKVLMVMITAICVNCSSGGSGGSTGACDGSLANGTWLDAISGDVLTFANSCSGTSSYCASTFTLPKITDSTGTITINMSTTNGAVGCAPAGQTDCAYSVSSSNLSLDCGGGVITYAKQ